MDAIKMTQKERLLKFCKMQGYSKNSLLNKLGMSAGAISHMGDNLSANVINRIKSNIPNCNIDWLLTGQGEMVLSSSEQTTQKDRLLLYATSKGIKSQNELERRLGMSQGSVSRYKDTLPRTVMLRMKDVFPQLNFQWLETGKGDTEVKHAPLDVEKFNGNPLGQLPAQPQYAPSGNDELMRVKDELIKQLQANLRDKDEIIAHLREKLAAYENNKQ